MFESESRLNEILKSLNCQMAQKVAKEKKKFEKLKVNYRAYFYMIGIQ